MRTSAFIATSLDGFIARADNSIDWLENADSDATEDYGYEAFIQSVTTVVMGRKTFARILQFPEWPFPDQRVVVLSTTLKSVPEGLKDMVQLFGGKVSELMILLESDRETHVYVDGSRAIQTFIKAGLLDDITITTIPILIGEGISLFGGPLAKDVRLDHISTRAYNNGFVQSTYQFKVSRL
ncbi:dihydrofolate reductase family protein [Reinekea marinisedimentorum]|uniref:Dihydrofolate reductase n=1 Tax=Reinekea marinisedimentorum TaxID=230495 RepID=A0A4R3I982_9GAMM|nr:dihydrofolate reductase family protein [Reinekea marinisedimentorum]TCS41613.1 dihydrofolate reductase [Reinekea marinisedimentorum]